MERNLLIEKKQSILNLYQFSVERLAAYAGAFGSIGVFLAGIYKYAIKPFYDWVVEINERNKMVAALLDGKTVDDFNKGQESIKQILYELKPNGGSSTKDAINEIRRLVKGISTDITQVKERQNVGIYLNPAPVFECDQDGHMISINKKFLGLLGMTTQEALGMGWTNQIHPDDVKRVMELWETAIESNSEFNCRYRFINKHTNAIIPVLATSTINRDADGKVSYIMGTFQILDDE